jgi:Low affinity iron permease
MSVCGAASGHDLGPGRFSATTIVTFLMVFLIQNAQNRDTEALLDLEELEDAELDRIRADDTELAKRARDNLRRGIDDTGRPPVAGGGSAEGR